MTLWQQAGTLAGLVVLAFTMGIAWQAERSVHDGLQREIDILKSVAVSEHPAYSPMLYPKE